MLLGVSGALAPIFLYRTAEIFACFAKHADHILLPTGCCSSLRGCEVDETDANTLSVECVDGPRSRLVTAPAAAAAAAAAECCRLLPSSAEVDDVLWTGRHRHRAVARLSRH